MEPYQQFFFNRPVPILADVIMKVKQMKDLSVEEEFVYLVRIEELPEEEAIKIIQGSKEDYTS